MENITLLFCGLLFIMIGIINYRGNIKTIHYYHRHNIKPNDILKYAHLIGIAMMIIGLFFIFSFFISFINKLLIPIIAITGLVIGIPLIIYAQYKYNDGFF